MKNRCRARKRVYEDNIDATGHLVTCSKRRDHRGRHEASATITRVIAVWDRPTHATEKKGT